MLNWMFKSSRRRRLAEAPFPAVYDEAIRRNVAHDAQLTPEEQQRLRRITRVLIEEKWWEGGRGFELNDEIKATVAAQAAMLLLNLKHDYYPRVKTIIVYETAYRVPMKGVMAGQPIPWQGRLGEAHERGPVIVSWADALAGGRNACDGRNVVFHEFAHALDMQAGFVDGTPVLPTRADYERWIEVMQREFEERRRACAGGQPRLLSTYACTNPAEFFAVSTEAYFEQGHALRDQHPDLYDVLNAFYRHDSADRPHRCAPEPATTGA